MRTTLTLDDDLAEKLRRLARRSRTTFKEVVNTVLRSGLTHPSPARVSGGRFRARTFRSAFCPGVDPLRLNALNDEIEAGRAFRKGARR